MFLLNKKLVVSDIDREGKLYSNVSRAYLRSEDAEIILDYHSILLRIVKDDVLYLQLFEGQEDVECDYQMNGMVYKIEEMGDGRVEVWISFGGLLMIQKIGKEQIVGLHDRSRVSLSVSKV